MTEKKVTSFATTVLLLIGILSFILSCSDLSDDETTERLQFAEYFFFPTAPYINKSYIEEVPADEVASSEIDYEAEKAAIQQVYSEFYKAFNDRDMNSIKKIMYTGFDMEFGVYVTEGFGGCHEEEVRYHASNWITIRGILEGFWSGVAPVCLAAPEYPRPVWGPNPTLSEFYIRPKNVNAPWDEASAKGFNFVGVNFDIDKLGETYVYFVKINGEWEIYQLVSLAPDIVPRYKQPPIDRYFSDAKYKAP